MSETAEAAAPVEAAAQSVAPVADALPGVPPLDAERLPPNFRKHVDPKAPVPLRGMAAKGLVPLGPSDMCHCLAMLAADADAGIVQAARKTAAGLPDKILSVGLRDEGQNPRVLDFFAEVLPGEHAALEYVVLNNTTHDLTVARILEKTKLPRIIEIVAANQLRLLREEKVLRALLANPASSKALIDGTCDFVVRSGLVLVDIPAMVEAHVRVHGVAPAMPGTSEAKAVEENTAEALLRDFASVIAADDSAPASAQAPEGGAEAPEAPEQAGKKLNVTQRIAKMNVAEKIKLASLGNKEARTILSREANRLILMAVITSPRITDTEVLNFAQSKTTNDDVLRVIMNSREWTRQHAIKLALVKNPKVPMAVALRFMTTLRDTEIAELSKNKNVSSGLRIQAKRITDKKQGGGKDK